MMLYDNANEVVDEPFSSNINEVIKGISSLLNFFYEEIFTHKNMKKKVH